MANEVIGKIVDIGTTETVGKNANQKRVFAIDYVSGKYNNLLAFVVWKDKCKLLDGMAVGDIVKVVFDCKSRCYEGKYYTDAVAWMIKPRDSEEGERDRVQPEPGSVDDINDKLDGAEMPF